MQENVNQDPSTQLAALAAAVREVYPDAQFVTGKVDRNTDRVALEHVLDAHEALIGTDAARFDALCPSLTSLDDAGALYDDGDEQIQAELD